MDRNAFHRLLAFGIERGASDIHYEVGYPPHYRVHGELFGAVKVPPLTAQDTEAIARMILEDRNLAIDFTRKFPELDISYVLEELGLPPVLAQLAGARRGLVLIAGATGNGKTTALAAMVRHINETRHAH